MSDIKSAMKVAGLTDEEMSAPMVEVWFVRVLEAEELLTSAGDRLRAGVLTAVEDAAQGYASTRNSGLPMYATSTLSADFDAALVRLLERRTALRMATEAI